MKLHYPIWLKRILLPYEFEDHPLHYDKATAEAEEARKEAEAMEGFRAVMGEKFVDRIDNL